ncbi:LuxR family transcriptional regulator [Mobilicoccus caccae]|uniref:LuxR family transcriptional regulator n=1 Tax=Mobilicoccus caccae TaxID=1859295 RepID=A0ABQ6IU98_9MICO|nr:LuxR family transcriptional regulator [Mobilicoccus caccae]GMA40712.1 LuxR family transcriptional regulator [Mobilicoccus caccae]
MITDVGETLIGRRRELDDLVARLADPCGPSVVLIEGPQGVGKTALVTAALARIAGGADGIVKVVGQDVDLERPHSVLARWVPDLDPDAGVDAVARALVEAWGRPRPRMILVEAGHSVHPTTVAALQAAALLTASRVLIAARPEPRIDLPDVHRIGLEGLSVAQTADLIRTHIEWAGDTAIRAAHTLTAGVPGDVLDLVGESPRAVWSERHPAFRATRRHRDRVAAVRDAVRPEAWALVQAAAVLGERADLSQAACLAGVDPSAVDDVILTGVVTAGSVRGRTTLAFTHPMYGLAVADLTGPTGVRERHRLAADHVTDASARLGHLVEASLGPDADLALDLATHAKARGAVGEWGQAAQAYADAARVAVDGDRARYLTSAVDAFVGAGRLPEAEALVAEVESFPRTGRTDATLGYLSILRGRRHDAQTWLSRAWAEVGGPDSVETDPDLAALVCTRMVLHNLALGDGRALLDWADRSAALGPGSVHATEADAIRCLGYGALGRWPEALAAVESVAGRTGAIAQTQRVTMGHGWLTLAMDDPLAARTALESATSNDYSFGSVRITLWAQAWLARTLFVLGRWDECLDVTHRAAGAIERTGHELIRPLVHWPAAVVHAYRGDDERSRMHLDAGLAADHDYTVMLLPSALAHAQVAECRGDHAGVVRALQPVAHTFAAHPEQDPGFWPWVDVYADALVMTDRTEEAREFLGSALEVATRQGRRSAIARTEIVLGRLHGIGGDLDAAVDSFDRAETLLSALPMPVERARLRFVHGQTLRRAGRRREADEMMRGARDAFAALGAQTYIARCDRELKAAGTRVAGTGQRRAAADGQLTPQESAVVDLVAAGRTNKEVAGELYISVKTVQYHLTRVYGKLGLRSRSELAAHVAAERDDAALDAEPSPEEDS